MKELFSVSVQSQFDPRAGQTNVDSTIRARNVMATDLVTVDRGTTVRQIARLLSDKHISAVPVVERGKLLGIVSEADILQRQELGTVPELPVPGEGASVLPAEVAKPCGIHAGDVMTSRVVTMSEDASLGELVGVLQSAHVKRILITRGSRLIGLVSRSDIVRALAARPEGGNAPAGGDDDIIRYRVIETLLAIPGTSPWATTVTVSHGVVELRGGIEDESARDPSRVAIEDLPYVVRVEDSRAAIQSYF